MARPKSIPDAVFNKAEKDFQTLKEGRVAIKLMAILAYRDQTSETIAKIFKLSQRHFLKIVKDYQKNGLEGLQNHPRGHNASKLDTDQLQVIKQWIIDSKTKDKKHVHWTLRKLKNEIMSVFNVNISTVAIWNHLHAMDMVLRIPRPSHYKGNKEQQEDFKKN